jgi:hypothetical protein
MRHNGVVARTWLSVQVELVSGRGDAFWPRPGRIIAAARRHTFWDLARAINLAFGRWDLSHLSEFVLADGTRISHADPWYDPPEGTIEIRDEKLSRLALEEQFAYTFDFGDGWTHLCRVGSERIDPVADVGLVPELPTAYFGWGTLPDQYGRRWSDDDGGEDPLPSDPRGDDLPPLLPVWRRLWQVPH